MDVSCWEQVLKCSDDGGEMWKLNLITCLKAGMRGHGGCGVLSRSRRLGRSEERRVGKECRL